MNLRPLVPQTSALTRLRHSPYPGHDTGSASQAGSPRRREPAGVGLIDENLAVVGSLSLSCRSERGLSDHPAHQPHDALDDSPPQIHGRHYDDQPEVPRRANPAGGRSAAAPRPPSAARSHQHVLTSRAPPLAPASRASSAETIRRAMSGRASSHRRARSHRAQQAAISRALPSRASAAAHSQPQRGGGQPQFFAQAALQVAQVGARQFPVGEQREGGRVCRGLSGIEHSRAPRGGLRCLR